MTDAIAPLRLPGASGAGSSPPLSPEEARDSELMRNAKAFEAVFVAQMLAHSGLGKALSADSGFGGEAFSTLLLERYAENLVEQGGFGLAEKIYEQLRAKGAPHVDRTDA